MSHPKGSVQIDQISRCRSCRDEAARFRQRAANIVSDTGLRDSYISAAIQYEMLAAVLDPWHMAPSGERWIAGAVADTRLLRSKPSRPDKGLFLLSACS